MEENVRGQELQRNEEEARRKEQQEVREKEQEVKREEEEVREKEEELRKEDMGLRKHETEVKKHEMEVRKHEMEVRKHEEEVKKREEEVRKCEEEVRKREEEVRKRIEEAQQKELEVGQKNEALDVDMTCARLFTLLQAPESFKKLVCLQEHQAQEMMDLLQKVRLVFMFPHHVRLTPLIWLSLLDVKHALFGSYLQESLFECYAMSIKQIWHLPQDSCTKFGDHRGLESLDCWTVWRRMERDVPRSTSCYQDS